ncbi:2-hydroxyacid dehydrogenase [Sphingobium sp. TB-6]|uniref:2-hydroxyacid dehydrogenase n=1 Tax=Sphingobium sp. TB-6 TaxID=2728850 RepID=UPI00146F4CE8|nr:2-hydroxyacid dehydrogenase [Sphingobium sp. TB-6]NML91827.1 2-hydroxyacid dehydrogenase [Sphingobium sp. TB-6]
MVDVLMTDPMHTSTIDQTLAGFTVHRLWQATDPEALLADVGGQVRGLIASGRPVSAALLDRLPALEIIANFGVGYDRIDMAAAAARGLTVTNTPGVLDDEVADFTIGLLLATIRRLPQADGFLRSGCWTAGAFPLSPTLRGRCVGLLGLGNIGQAIARRLEAFGVPIAYHSRHPRTDVPYTYHPTVEALAKASDVLILSLPGGSETRHLVNADVLDRLGRDGVLINVARGSVVDEAALIAALRDGRILAAGLDVFTREPQIPAELIAMENVVLLPHIGSASVQTRAAMGDLVLANIVGWFEGRGAVTPVA